MTRKKPRREYDPLPRRNDHLPLRRGPDGAYEPLPRRDARETHVGNGSGGDCAIAMRVKKGRRVGRLKGVPNKLTRVLREAILLAAEQCPHSRGRGLVGYLTYLATEHPRTFSRSLLARLIPHDLRLRAEVTAPLETADEVRQKLRDRGIPVDKMRLRRRYRRTQPTRRPLPIPGRPRCRSPATRRASRNRACAWSTTMPTRKTLTFPPDAADIVADGEVMHPDPANTPPNALRAPLGELSR
jgi:hypothetical protein